MFESTDRHSYAIYVFLLAAGTYRTDGRARFYKENRECAWPPLTHGSVEPGGYVGSHRNDEMVPVSTTSDFLLTDARAALRRRLTESCRTELSKAFAAWLLREPDTDAEFASLVSEAATREGAQQDFQTVAILGFGAEAGILGAAQIEVLKRGLQRQAGREVVIDGLPVALFRCGGHSWHSPGDKGGRRRGPHGSGCEVGFQVPEE